ncbi:hypothetical protein J2X06_003183 [Lysobacter niastensis]|uniref:Uncharacterized protein n=1 Tax=Lysobacter niastensis TaxID=380629 RepID=A0ABU1WEE3_9GAMM|nr:hypothetical protein [Lysobacter niastensis]
MTIVSTGTEISLAAASQHIKVLERALCADRIQSGWNDVLASLAQQRSPTQLSPT